MKSMLRYLSEYKSLPLFIIGIVLMISLTPTYNAIVFQICFISLLSSFALLFQYLDTKGYLTKDFAVKALLSIGVVLFAFEPLTKQSGWPANHDMLSWKYRAVAYYQHFQQLDFFPLWSSGDCFNLGTPLPLYYHKLFNHLLTIIYTVSLDMKVSTIISLMIFSLIGIAGLYKCLNLMKIDSRLSLFLSWSFILMNYSITDWLVRGALNEYSAMMLIPFLIYWCIDLILNNKFKYTIIIILTLIFLAHNIIAFYGMFFIAISVIIAIWNNFKTSFIKSILKKGIISSISFFLINAPYLIPILILSDNYDVSKILTNYTVDRHYRNFITYFYDINYTWGLNHDSYSVELNAGFTILLVFLLMSLLYHYLSQSKPLKINLKLCYFLFISFFWLMFMQSRFSLFIYQHFPGASFIQFPWRLLSFIEIMGLLLIGFLLSAVFSNVHIKRSIAFIYFITLVIFNPFVWPNKKRNWEWMDRDSVEEVINKGVWGTGGEYIPKVKGVKYSDLNFYEKLASRGCEVTDSASGNIQSIPFENPESLTRIYRVDLRAKNTVVLPVNFSGLELVYTENENIKLKAYRIEEDPRIRIDLQKGNHELILKLPTLKTAFINLMD